MHLQTDFCIPLDVLLKSFDIYLCDLSMHVCQIHTIKYALLPQSFSFPCTCAICHATLQHPPIGFFHDLLWPVEARQMKCEDHLYVPICLLTPLQSVDKKTPGLVYQPRRGMKDTCCRASLNLQSPAQASIYRRSMSVPTVYL